MTCVACAEIGRYRFYVYEGPAVDNMTSALQLPPITQRYAPQWDHADNLARNMFPEYTAAVWVHRALLHDPSRTLDPDEAELFFAPAYLEISAILPGHTERLTAWLMYIRNSRHFQRNGGRDHLFASSDVREDHHMELHGHARVSSLLHRGFTGTFEMRPGWTGGWPLENMIVMPYVANPFLTSRSRRTSFATKRDVALFYVAHGREQAAIETNCNRKIMKLLSDFRLRYHGSAALPSVVMVGWQMMSQVTYARRIARAYFCPLTCGDTATSRRTFDAVVSGCVPIFVGTRLWGRCDFPCRGTITLSLPHTHLPFEGMWINWSVFPRIDEGRLYAQTTRAGVHAVFRAAMMQASGRSAALQAQLRDARDHLIYGWGDYRSSPTFGLASRRLVESAIMRLRLRRRVG